MRGAGAAPSRRELRQFAFAVGGVFAALAAASAWRGHPGRAAALAVVGVCVIGTFGVTMVMSQEYLPRHIGMASGLTVGLGIGLGGVAALGLGAIGDAAGLRTALTIAAVTPFIALALALRLPSSRGPARAAEVVSPA